MFCEHRDRGAGAGGSRAACAAAADFLLGAGSTTAEGQSMILSRHALQGISSPEADHAQPFEWLRACHDRVERMLDLLQRLHEHVQRHGADAQAVDAAAQVQRYFDLAAPLHHEDEERHVFPRVLALGDPRLRALVSRLQDDHAAMASDWTGLRGRLHALQAAAGDVTWRWTEHDHRWLAQFAQRYKLHIAAEEDEVFAAALQAMTKAEQAAMSEDMLRRRAIAPSVRGSS
ncbi:hemerythrin domain-containing protein [Tepidimonas thermarum]|nr:hemerythrin domain-containing protein [Tepidimonas thermarum]